MNGLRTGYPFQQSHLVGRGSNTLSNAPRASDRLWIGWLTGRGDARAEDAQGTPTPSRISPSILVCKDDWYSVWELVARHYMRDTTFFARYIVFVTNLCENLAHTPLFHTTGHDGFWSDSGRLAHTFQGYLTYKKRQPLRTLP